jgi:hypothetical protein
LGPVRPAKAGGRGDPRARRRRRMRLRADGRLARPPFWGRRYRRNEIAWAPLPWSVAVLLSTGNGADLRAALLGGTRPTEAIATPSWPQRRVRARASRVGSSPRKIRSRSNTKGYLRAEHLAAMKARESELIGEWLYSWFSPATRRIRATAAALSPPGSEPRLRAVSAPGRSESAASSRSGSDLVGESPVMDLLRSVTCSDSRLPATLRSSAGTSGPCRPEPRHSSGSGALRGRGSAGMRFRLSPARRPSAASSRRTAPAYRAGPQECASPCQSGTAVASRGAPARRGQAALASRDNGPGRSGRAPPPADRRG